MARFTNIGMPRKRHVASAAEEARAVDPQPEAEAGPSEEPAVPKKKTHRGGYKLKRKRERAAEAAAAAAAAEHAGATGEGEGEGRVSEAAEAGDEGERTAKRQQNTSQGWGRNADIARTSTSLLWSRSWSGRGITLIETQKKPKLRHSGPKCGDCSGWQRSRRI
jgi:hypothetical protein